MTEPFLIASTWRRLEKAEVAFVPGEAFGSPGYARFSFALADADLEEGLRRLQEFAS